VNLILLESGDFVTPMRVRLTGRRLAHVREICRSAEGDTLRVGEIGGKLGTGRIVHLGADHLDLEVAFAEAAPPPHPVTLAVALPRPPSVRKVLQQATALGVKRILFVHSHRVEKSYWQSSGLRPSAVHEQILLGLEQARDTIPPVVELHPRFRTFADDVLPKLAEQGRILVAHPDATAPLCGPTDEPVTLVIGPEGGFIDSEIERLRAAGAALASMGPRVLRVETAVVAALGRMAPWRDGTCARR
jgi:RsmE family RNA methyltransferase